MKLKKNIVGLGVAVGLAVAGVGGFFAIEACWLTSSERGAAQTALAAIDQLQNVGSVSDEDFSARADQAEQAIEAARQAAVTNRDQDVAYALMRYFGSTIKEQDTMRMEIRAERSSTSADRDPASDPQLHTAEFATRHSLSSSLHETLD
jgi:hypothetical protein